MRRLTILAGVLAATTLTGTPAALAAKAPPMAVKVAVTAAQTRFHTTHIHADFTLLSRRDRRWALVDGFASARNRLWAAWLHNDRANRWTLRYFDTSAPFEPGSTSHGRVPCDLYPAFSEPACPSGPSARRSEPAWPSNSRPSEVRPVSVACSRTADTPSRSSRHLAAH